MTAATDIAAAGSRYWADLSTLEFARRQADGRAARTVAVLPVAATEQHGPHLPVSVDAAIAQGVIDACLPHLRADAQVLFLPVQQVGKSDEHIAFPGTLTLGAETLIRVWCEIGASVARAGVKKLLLFNTHGGQVSVMDIVARELRGRHDLIVLWTSWHALPLGDDVMGMFPPAEHRFGIHGGDIETSMMLALLPQHVDMAQARQFASSSQARAQRYPILGNGTSVKLGWHMQDYNAMGAAGDATQASAEKGRALVDAAGRQLAALLHEIEDLPPSTRVQETQLPL